MDTGVLSYVVDKPGKNLTVTNAQNWLLDLLSRGIDVYTPEICDYELRRELIRTSKQASITRLDTLISGTNYSISF